MQTAQELEHFTTSKKPVRPKNLDHLLQKLITKYTPLQIFCFHKHLEKKESIGCFMETAEVERCNYYLLMVTEGLSRIEHAVQDFANAHYNQGSVIILVHGRTGIERSISEGHGFFKTVYRKGQLLYNHTGFFQINSFAESIGVSSGMRDDKNRRFKEGISRAEGFLLGAQECLSNGKNNVCAFMLHQAVEQCCIALVGVHMGYRCDIHSLYRLLMLCRCFSEAPFNLFVMNKAIEDQLFTTLIDSYLKARYFDGFIIENTDLMKLCDLCFCLVEFTKNN